MGYRSGCEEQPPTDAARALPPHPPTHQPIHSLAAAAAEPDVLRAVPPAAALPAAMEPSAAAALLVLSAVAPGTAAAAGSADFSSSSSSFSSPSLDCRRPSLRRSYSSCSSAGGREQAERGGHWGAMGAPVSVSVVAWWRQGCPPLRQRAHCRAAPVPPFTGRHGRQRPESITDES